MDSDTILQQAHEQSGRVELPGRVELCFRTVVDTSDGRDLLVFLGGIWL
jgi:hypothetical protein